MKIPVTQIERSVERYNQFDRDIIRPKIEKFEEDIFYEASLPVERDIVEGNIVGDTENLKLREAMLKESRLEPMEFAFERAIGNNDSVYSNFVELIANAKQKVGRIVIQYQGRRAFATGFLVSPNLVLTNWHVFKEKRDSLNSFIQFNYELDISGQDKEAIVFDFEPDLFFYSYKDLDYCFIAINDRDRTRKYSISTFGHISMISTLGKLGDEGKERLNIIHHPNGERKQLSIRQNVFKRILPTTLWYESDTAQGSSGSPVFNDQWQLVALHHSGVPERDKDGNFLDKNGNIIPIDHEGMIDDSLVVWIANEGIRISVILKHIMNEFPDNKLISGLVQSQKKEGDEAFLPENGTSPNLKTKDSTNHSILTNESNRDKVSIHIPQTIFSQTGHFNLNLSTRGGETSSLNSDISKPKFVSGLDIFESRRLEKEYDYSICVGYESDFLGAGHEVQMPMPMDEIKHEIAKIHYSSQIVLDYFKFSVIHNAHTKMPLISAINIDGNPNKRLDVTKRRDKWIRDNRIDFNSQLDDDFYRRSGFDRGHLSRREDANWGESPETAKRNADLTCVYTNACPQVPELNRSNRGGLWGKLEKIILEKGAEKESGIYAKINVFSGPIHSDTDPEYKGSRIPLNYYKIICWISDKNKLKVTAFILSQKNNLSKIRLEEALDIDKDVEFSQYQISLKELQKLTKINFSHLFKLDTFSGEQKDICTELDVLESFKN